MGIETHVHGLNVFLSRRDKTTNHSACVERTKTTSDRSKCYRSANDEYAGTDPQALDSSKIMARSVRHGRSKEGACLEEGDDIGLDQSRLSSAHILETERISERVQSHRRSNERSCVADHA